MDNYKKNNNELIESSSNFPDAAFQLLVERNHQAIIVFQDNQIVFANQAATDLSGYSNEDLLSMDNPIKNIIHPEDFEFINKRHQKIIQNEDVLHNPFFRIVQKNGNVSWLESTNILVVYQGKSAFCLVFSDISETFHAEQRIRVLSSALEQSSYEIVITNKEGIIEYMTALKKRLDKTSPNSILRE
ncbi:MAG: PAS domain S-box protein [Anaerolineaceae bacterium]|nr:PAS domain S-box protein [Anaerolineaceae bacterium]